MSLSSIGHLLDPCYWVQKNVKLVPAEAEKRVFDYKVDGVYVPLTYAKLLSRMKDMLAKAGFLGSPHCVVPHACRRVYLCKFHTLWRGAQPLLITVASILCLFTSRGLDSISWLLYIGLRVDQMKEVTLSMQRGSK
jgi:hypothetical protein